MTVNDAPNRPGQRTIWGWIGFAVDRAVLLFLAWVVLVMVGGGSCLAWLDLTGPHCDGQVMRSGDTCSTLSLHHGRSTKQLEQLNPPGAAPAVLTLPGYQHPERIEHGVYGADGMRRNHLPWGLGGLVLAALPTLILVLAWRQARRAKRAKAVRPDEAISEA